MEISLPGLADLFSRLRSVYRPACRLVHHSGEGESFLEYYKRKSIESYYLQTREEAFRLRTENPELFRNYLDSIDRLVKSDLKSSAHYVECVNLLNREASRHRNNGERIKRSELRDLHAVMYALLFRNKVIVGK